ncbi:YvrJ family protein [Clostridium sp. DL1XJH146]
MYQDFANLISTVGFPIGVSIFLLVRFEKKIEELTQVLTELKVVVTAVIEDKER